MATKLTKHEILKIYFGFDQFREGQEPLIDALIAGRDLLGVMPTGSGKSLCYQMPAMCFDGITLVISPLIALMQDQVAALGQAGIRAAYINSSLTAAQCARAIQNAGEGLYKIIYVAPERLHQDRFLRFAENADIALVAVDEAHCVSQWGQDFRPSYLKIADFVDRLRCQGRKPRRPPVAALTATATEVVRQDIVEKLRLQTPLVQISGFNRENLYFSVRKPKDKFRALIDFLGDKRDKAGIIYCMTRKQTSEVCGRLNACGFPAVRYHAGLSDAERKAAQADFTYDRVNIIVATNAFGMGIDKSNVSYVVHYNLSIDIESYYQEAGRAGRDGQPADCVLFYDPADAQMGQFLINNNKEAVYEDAETAHRLKERALARLKQMVFYCYTHDCLRGFLLRYFGEKPKPFCGHCLNCDTQSETLDISVDAKKIISCVIRAGERFGIGMIIDILRGRSNERIVQYGLHQLTTFGLMRETSDKRLRDMIQYLLINEYLQSVGDRYPLIKVTANARTLLYANEPLVIKLLKDVEATAAPQARAGTLTAVNPALFERLKALRLRIANEEKVPAFVIFSDATLVDMCMKLPRTPNQFLVVNGVGHVKMNRYGAAFLAELQSFITSVRHDKTAFVPVLLQSVETEQDKIAFHAYLATLPELVEQSEEPLSVSQFADRINSILARRYQVKLTAGKLTQWLLQEGLLKNVADEHGRYRQLPTTAGEAQGIIGVQRTGKSGADYTAVQYTQQAQAYLLTRLPEMMTLFA